MKFLKAAGAILLGIMLLVAVSRTSSDGTEPWRWALITGPFIGVAARWLSAFSRNKRIGSRSILNSGIVGGGLLAGMVAATDTGGGTSYSVGGAIGAGAVSGLAFGGAIALIVFGIRSIQPSRTSLDRSDSQTFRTAIRRWHQGQLVLYWIAHLFAAWVMWGLVIQDPSVWPRPIRLFVAFAFLIGIPVSLFSVTWIWLGREKPQPTR
jgi:hypothetical protein